MAAERDEDERSAQTEQAGGPGESERECMPCRGSGKVISHLGGEEHSVDCPWCEGTGRRIEGIDAQARWPVEQGEPQPAASAAQSDGAS